MSDMFLAIAHFLYIKKNQLFLSLNRSTNQTDSFEKNSIDIIYFDGVL